MVIEGLGSGFRNLGAIECLESCRILPIYCRHMQVDPHGPMLFRSWMASIEESGSTKRHCLPGKVFL